MKRSKLTARPKIGNILNGTFVIRVRFGSAFISLPLGSGTKLGMRMHTWSVGVRLC